MAHGIADPRSARGRSFALIIGGIALIAVLALLLILGGRGADTQLRAVMREHGLTAASLAYGRIGEEPGLLAINTRTDRVLPYYSLSKPITAAAVMAQIGYGTLNLSDQVNGATIRQLLQHTGGWDRAIAGDPVTQRKTHEPCTQVPVPPKQIAPGQRFAYSNLGYCLLGKAIAQSTGLSYRDAVNRDVPQTRHMTLDTWLGPAGGWSGTARAYFRFAARPLPPGTTDSPVPRPGDVPYGLGWGVGPDGLLTHFGALRHNFAIVVRKDDLVAVALFEGRPADDEAAAAALRPLLLELASGAHSR